MIKHRIKIIGVRIISILFGLSLVACGGGGGGGGGGSSSQPAFSTSDLSGTWYIYGASSGGSSEGTIRGTVIMNASGQITGGSYTHSDGTVATLTGGTVAIDGSGVLSGTATTNIGVTITVTSGKMNSAKTMLSFVDSTNLGELDLVIAIKAN